MISYLKLFGAETSPESSTTAIIIVAVLSLVGTIATVGYKYKNADKKQDPNQVIFDQVNSFIAEQRKERDDLRKELKVVKDELRLLTDENEQLRKDLNKERSRNNVLARRISTLTDRADIEDHDKEAPKKRDKKPIS